MATVRDPEGYEIEALAAVIPSFESLRIVEIGSGNGRLTRRYARGTASIVAIDTDASALAELTAALPGIDARVGSATTVDLPPRSADVVLFAWSL